MTKSFLDEFFEKKENNTGNISYIQLLQEYVSNGETLHIFVEDEDDFQFYRHWIGRIYTKHLLFYYPQKGKQNVLDFYSRIDWNRFRKCRLLFFYDKDFDDFLNVQHVVDVNVFCTKHYSIENYLVTDEVLQILIEEVYGCKQQEIVEHLLDDAKEKYSTFIDALLVVTAWILVYRKKNADVDLDGLTFGNFFHIDKTNLVTKRYKCSNSYRAIIQDRNVPPSEKAVLRDKKLKTLLEERAEADPSSYDFRLALVNYRQLKVIKNKKAYVRGKYELWFLIEVFFQTARSFFKHYNERAKSYNKNNEDKKRTYSSNMELNSSNIFHVIPAKMRVPEDIESFLNANLLLQ